MEPAAPPPKPWEPGAPSLRAMLPSILGGAIVPLVVYFVVRGFVDGDATALIIAGIFPAAWIVIQWVRHRQVDLVGAIVLFGFVAGVVVSVLLGGNAFVLKVRDTGFTAGFGVVCLVSLAARRPMMFYIGKILSAGSDAARRSAYDELWGIAAARRVFAVVTVCWGFGLIFEAAGSVTLAVVLPTGAFLAASPALAFVLFGGLFAWTALYSRRARRLGEADLAAAGQAFPSVVG